MTATVHAGDCRDVLRSLPERSVQTVITSPPFFGLRDYGTGVWEGGDPACDHVKTTQHREQPERPKGWDGAFRYTSQPLPVAYSDVCGRCGARRVDRQIGLEPSPDEFVAALVGVFREVRRVLRDDGCVWINLGDSYAGVGGTNHDVNGPEWKAAHGGTKLRSYRSSSDTKPKDLIGVPWLVAFALRADGWYLRSDIIWSKPSPMPESVTDRPTRSHEFLFLLSKRPAYFYDQDAIREEVTSEASIARNRSTPRQITPPAHHQPNGDERGYRAQENLTAAGRNKRSVWTVPTTPFSSERLGLGETEHFAVFPPKLVEPCVLAGSAARACGVCGAPWRRVVERETTGRDERGIPVGEWADRGIQRHRAATRAGDSSSRTVGWEPSCDHWLPCAVCGEAPGYTSGMARVCLRHAEPVVCSDGTGRSVVLDPFAGSGTVGVVCGWHGRDFIGIELSAANARLAEKRIALEGRPGGRPASHEPARVNGHPSLFDGLDV